MLYWPGLRSWFQRDDFVWLKLLQIARESQGFLWALFHPMAQGTMRTLSERAFFMSFYALFGLNALPYHLWAFLTFAASLVVLSSLCTKFTHSRAAGFWAAMLWMSNSAMAYALSWASVYHEILCSLVFLGGLWMLARYVETGDKQFYVAQWITFLLGFLVLELNVVYPALATAYALCFARRILSKVWPMFLASAAYIAIHTAAAPLPHAGPYKLHWDSSAFATLWTYWKSALGPNRLIVLHIYPSPSRSLLAVLLTSGLIGFLVWRSYRREWMSAFFAAWFVIVLSPLLPLRDHIEPSYLTIPLIGFAMWGAWAVVRGWRAGWFGKIATVLLLGIYLGVSIPVARVVAESQRVHSQEARGFILDVAAQTGQQKNRLVLLKKVNGEQFWSVVYYRPFPLFGIREVYLLRGDDGRIVPPLPAALVPAFMASSEMIRAAIEEQRALVLDVSGVKVRDVTADYAR